MLKLFIVIINIVVCRSVGIFNQVSEVRFEPNGSAEYFGYTVVLTESSLYVGAPKAATRKDDASPTGAVFKCQINHFTTQNIKCDPLQTDENRNVSRFYGGQRSMKESLRSDMWFGATIALLPNEKILICAPRFTVPYQSVRASHMLAHGLCYIQSSSEGSVLKPLSEMKRQAYIIDGKRKEYGDYGTTLNFYAYGQAGFSIKVTENDNIIIGAPGLLQWTGGIVDYKYLQASKDTNRIFVGKQQITNPYFTKELGPDNYFGYTVESGVFETNGSNLYVAAAPRSKMTYGQVLIFEPASRETEPLNIRVLLRGPQLGSYFGASLCTTDINGDGRTDLLVGAPNYVKREGLPFDQGAVFVYLNHVNDSGFTMLESGHVTGSEISGARFGYAIADLGDVDGDGFTDVAIGAPWEDNGKGAVYIYRGSRAGLKNQYVQRITSSHSTGFGVSVSGRVDVDGNKCNDLAIGAYSSSSAHVYRCTPTVKVTAMIKVHDAMDLPQNATNFTVLFCVHVTPNKLWPSVKINLKAKMTVDKEEGRAVLTGDDEYNVVAIPGQDGCHEEFVKVKSTADLSRPIHLKFDLEQIDNTNITNTFSHFDKNKPRLSEDSELHSSFDIQLTRDCGEDLICQPLLDMSLDSIDVSPYIPGSGSKLGVKVTILNKGEPAFGAKVKLGLPLPPQRVPTPCSLEGFNLTCNIPAPLLRKEKVVWDIELEYTQNTTEETDLLVSAILEDPFYIGNISENGPEKLILKVTPKANITVTGEALPNITVPVTRHSLDENGNVTIVHYYELLNYGPSDWTHLTAEIQLSEKVTLPTSIQGCTRESLQTTMLRCIWTVAAKTSLPIIVTLRFDLADHGGYLIDNDKINVTTAIILPEFNRTANVTSTLVLDPAPPVWPLIVGSLFGLLMLAAIVYGLYKHGFFSRQDREKLKQLQNNQGEEPSINGSNNTLPMCDADNSSRELILDSDED